MRTLYISLALIIATASSAQLVNGSFESALGFDHDGWQFGCNAPNAVHDTPPGGGEWSARKEVGNVKGCPASYLYQQIPFAHNGEVWTLSAWTRSDTVGILANASICFGQLLGGDITLQESTGWNGLEWTYLSITDTIMAGPGEVPLVVLNPGTTGGPATGAAWFDNVQLVQEMAQGIHEHVQLHPFLDLTTSMLHVSVGDHAIHGIRLFDLTGKVLSAEMRIIGGNADIDLRALRAGVYLVQVITGAGPASARFVKP